MKYSPEERSQALNDALTRPPLDEEASALARPHVGGKFLFEGDQKLWIKGVTYGTFRPQEDGSEFPQRSTVAADFAMMVEQGINCLRT